MYDIKLIVCAVLVLIMYVSTLGFIFSDLWSGVRGCKDTHGHCSSAL